MKLFTLLFFTFSTLLASSFSFNETRYSDALEDSRTLEGIIHFGNNSLSVEYTGHDKKIFYSESTVTLEDKGIVVAMSQEESQNIAHFLEIILLLHNASTSQLSEKFYITKNENNTNTLKPKGSLSQFIEKITLKKSDKTLKSIQLFLTNNDHILISIEDEIR